MNSSVTLAPINDLLEKNATVLVDEWLTDILRVWSKQYPAQNEPEQLRQQANRLLRELKAVFVENTVDTLPDISENKILCALIGELSAERAKNGIKPADTAQFILALKNVLTQHLVHNLSRNPADLITCLRAVEDVLDRLSLLTFEAYVDTREKIITQQSLSLLELSTPVVLLWKNILMLPLVGVIDTVRARQFTERLLESIARYEATVTIIDVTGVPVFDTSVARHVMKAVDAAKLLGSRIVITGISPEGAQTLTKLGIGFENVISRATLRAGVAEAFHLVGRRVVAGRGDSE